jgi:hypothetical protein
MIKPKIACTIKAPAFARWFISAPELVRQFAATVGGAVGFAATFFVYTLRDPASPPATPAVALVPSLTLNGIW